jgi:7-cyano-7-deazaguanine synthase
VNEKAIVLLSGGIDSAVSLYIARQRGFACRCLIFDYGQRHCREIDSAQKIAAAAGCACEVLKINLAWKGSSLLDRRLNLSTYALRLAPNALSIPDTYVPGRNIIFLSFAVSFAEAAGAQAVFIGAHSQDYSGYPDCRPEFYSAFRRAIKKGTRCGAEGKCIRIIAPLLRCGKAEIIRRGMRLKVPFHLTWSCYSGGAGPCGNCDSCFYREKGFQEAGMVDPLTLEALA